MNQTLRALALLALGVLAAVAHTQAQVFPDKPVRLIVGGGPVAFPTRWRAGWAKGCPMFGANRS